MKITGDVLNVFTDCSTDSKNQKNGCNIAPGILIMKGRIFPEVLNCRLFSNANSGFGEVYAILMGIEKAIYITKIHPEIKRINIFSDYLAAVEILRHMNKKFRFVPNMTSDDVTTMIKNDSYVLDNSIIYPELFVDIVKAIGNIKKEVRFYYVPSHTMIGNAKKLAIAMDKFCAENNGEKISREDIIWACSNNSLIDRETRKKLRQYISGFVSFRSIDKIDPNNLSPITINVKKDEYYQYLNNTHRTPLAYTNNN